MCVIADCVLKMHQDSRFGHQALVTDKHEQGQTLQAALVRRRAGSL